MPAELKLMAISEIMEMVSGSVDLGNLDSANDWWRVIAAKASAAHFDAIVDTIQSEGFGMPMVICDRYSNGNYVIGNGHHRFVAAMLLGLWRIPVMVSEGSNRDDFMRPEDSMDDYGKPIDTWGNEYYQLLQGNMENGYGGSDDYEESDHPEFYCELCCEYLRNSVECCHTDHLALQHPECDKCEQRDCGGDCECAECGAIAHEYESHLMGCPERDWELVWCADCWTSHYRKNACDNVKARIEADAYSEANLIALSELLKPVTVPAYRGHPEAVLADAYGEHEVFVRGEALRAARAAWDAANAAMREAVGYGAGAWVMLDHANAIVAAQAEWCAIADN